MSGRHAAKMVVVSPFESPDPVLRCPNCAGQVVVDDASVRCASGHHFDRSRSGHVNLAVGGRLARQSGKGEPGDSREMLEARQRFFDGGHYRPVMDRLAELAAGAERAIDIGCGVGSYLARLPVERRYGFDLAKSAVNHAARRDPAALYAVASSVALPVHDRCVDFACCVFAPFAADEIARVARPGATAVIAGPGDDHLAELRSLIYAEPSRRGIGARRPIGIEGWTERSEAVRFVLDLDASAATDLLAMTPYWWSAGPELQAAMPALTVTVHVVLQVVTAPS